MIAGAVGAGAAVFVAWLLWALCRAGGLSDRALEQRWQWQEQDASRWLAGLLDVTGPDRVVTPRGVELPLGELGYEDALVFLAELETL